MLKGQCVKSKKIWQNFHASLRNLSHFLWKNSRFLMLNGLKSCFFYRSIVFVLFDVEQRIISRKNLEIQEIFENISIYSICY
jgi:hypothetical protein